MYKLLGPVLVILIAGILMLFQPAVRDVNFLPIVLMGMLLSPGVLGWIVGKKGLFDPSALVTVLLFQFLVVSPTLLFIVDRYGLPMIETRPLLGRTMLFCIPAVIAFLIGQSVGIGRKTGDKLALTVRELDIPRATMACYLLIIMGLIATLGVRLVLFARGITFGTRFSAATGLGIFMTIANFLRIGLLFALLISIQKHLNFNQQYGATSKFKTFFVAAVIMTIIIFLVFLKGSRGLIIMHLFWIAAILHYSVKRIKFTYIVLPLILALPVLHIYGLYKAFGITAFADYFNPARRASMEEHSRQSMVGVLAGDLGRANVWMFANQEISSGRFEHTLGSTYISGSVIFVPRLIWPGRPYGIPAVITDMHRGKGTYHSTREKTARVAGLIGEAYINFGWPFTIIVMFIYGVVVRAITEWINNSPNTVPKAFWAPLMTLMCLYLFMWDWGWNVYKMFDLILPTYIFYRLTMPIINLYENKINYDLVGEYSI